jgi:large subunit ribosomal protein L22
MAAPETRSQVRAEARYVRAAPRKTQLIVDQIRGRPVPEARTILAFMTRDAARDVAKVLNSAAANAEANHGLHSDELIVAAAYVGAGPTLKRWRPRARGRVGRIHKRTSHITVALALPTGAELPEPIEQPAVVTLTEEPEPITVDETGAEVAPAEEEAPAEEKPKRARTPRKKAVEPAAAEAPAAETEEKPKPKRTRAAKPKAEDETAEKPKAPAKPKTARKKTTETEIDEGGEG